MGKILISDPIGEDGIVYLKQKGHTVVLEPDITPDELLSAISDVSALIVRGRTKVTHEVIESGPNLKVIARSGTGVDNVDLAAASEHGVIVVNAPGANAESVAEHTMALILALSRSIVSTVLSMRSGKWAKDAYRGMELKGKTLGVVGFGTIGPRVAELGTAFGMEVVVCSHKPPSIGRSVSLQELLAISDIVSLHIPLTQETRGLIGKKELDVMKKSACLINTSRGAVVDEKALTEALKESRISGAALDVYETEPLPSDSPLLALPNVITTPHVAAMSPESENRASLMVAEDVDRVLTGQKALREVHI